MGIVNRMARMAGKYVGTTLGNKVRHDRAEAIRKKRGTKRRKPLDLGEKPVSSSIFKSLESGWKW